MAVSTYTIKNGEHRAEIDEIKMIMLLDIIRYRNATLYKFIKEEIYDKIEPNNTYK